GRPEQQGRCPWCETPPGLACEGQALRERGADRCPDPRYRGLFRDLATGVKARPRPDPPPKGDFPETPAELRAMGVPEDLVAAIESGRELTRDERARGVRAILDKRR